MVDSKDGIDNNTRRQARINTAFGTLCLGREIEKRNGTEPERPKATPVTAPKVEVWKTVPCS